MHNVESLRTGSFVVSGRRLPAIAALSRLIHGVATVLLVRAAEHFPPIPDAGSVGSVIPILCVVCGVAVGTAVERIVATRFGRQYGALFSWLLITLGLLLAALTPTFEGLCIAAFIAGMGMTGDWSSMTEMARNATSARERWKAMRWVTSAFAIGVLIGVGFDEAVHIGFVVCLAGGLAIIAAVWRTRDIPPDSATQAVDAAVEVRPCEVKRNEPEAVTPGGEECATDPDDCDASECCGGSAREFTPMSFRTGVVVAAIGSFAFWGVFANLLLLKSSDTWILTIAAIGLTIGYILMRSAAPAGGYTLVLLPFLLGCVLTAFAPLVVSVNSPWYAIVRFFEGLFAGGVTCGTSAMLGEQFTDCSSDPKRTRVLCVSLFATAIILLAAAGMNSLMVFFSVSVILREAIFVIGILAVRSIPSPLISNLGTDEFDADSESELKDIVAAIKQ